MKTYIVYIGADEMGTIKAGSHNAAEKKARKMNAPSVERINQYLRINPHLSREQAINNLTSNISVAYTEI